VEYFVREATMTDIGINKAGIDQNIILGREIGKFGKTITDKEKALALAKVHEGSEIVYKADDGSWQVNEVKEEGLTSGLNDISSTDKADLTLDAAKMKKAGINNAVFSFVDEEADLGTKLRVASDPATYPEVLNQLATGEQPDAAFNNQSEGPVWLFKEIVNYVDPDKDPRLKINVINNPGTNLETIKGLAGDSDPSVRAAIINNPRIPVEMLKEFAKDSDPSVRITVVQNPRTTLETLKVLAKDSDPSIRAAVINNPKTPVEVLKDLAKDPDPGVRTAVINNPKTNTEILQLMENEESSTGKLALAANKNTPYNIIKDLSYDLDPEVRINIAKNPKTPIAMLTEMSIDKASGVRAAIVNNPKTPVSTLKKMENEKSPEVMMALSGNKKTPENVLTNMTLYFYQNEGFLNFDKNPYESFEKEIDFLKNLAANPSSSPKVTEAVKITLEDLEKRIRNYRESH
jgi:hypothetical protein